MFPDLRLITSFSIVCNKEKRGVLFPELLKPLFINLSCSQVSKSTGG